MERQPERVLPGAPEQILDGMPLITPEFVRGLIDFAPTEETKRLGFSENQLEGTVALFNMLARNRCAYLADEVGMGKTYIALAVMSLVRYFKPNAHIIVIAPRENIQRKWVKELTNFVRLNWKYVGSRVKSLQGGPVWKPVLCRSLLDLAHQAILNEDRDFFLRMTSFSLALKQVENRRRLRKELRRLVPWLSPHAISPKTPEGFRDAFGCALNAAIPEADLVIVDEGHNLKHGFRAKGSIRNRIMGFAFGHPEGASPERPWYGPRVKRLLMLSATPFEEEYAAVARQFAVFGFGEASLHDAAGGPPVCMSDLEDSELTDCAKREVVARLMVRRVSGLRIADEFWTKNMYRREWRMGGYHDHDHPMHLEDPKQRLVVGLMQKKVAEILQSEKFNNHFQIGMLSSFESFLESVEVARKSKARREQEATATAESVPLSEIESSGNGAGDAEEEGRERTFDGQQKASSSERRGIDTAAIARVVESYRRQFGRSLPHPKLDATARALASVFDSGEKTLVFVRRVATVRELAGKLDAEFDAWLRRRLETSMPQRLHPELANLFVAYEKERPARPEERFERLSLDTRERETDELRHERHFVDEEDTGSGETFFSWFFRGTGPDGVLSGAAFQKNRLSSVGSLYSTLFEDDHVTWLLGRPEDPLAALCAACRKEPERFLASLRESAYRHFLARSKQKEGYPRLFVFQCYQVAALEQLAHQHNELAEKARIVLEERHPGLAVLRTRSAVPDGFPEPDEALGITTFISELVGRPRLREALWPDEHASDFRTLFRRREQRRELLSGMSRLGAAYIDLYCTAMVPLESFGLRSQTETARSDTDLAMRFADLLERQRETPGFNAYRELAEAAGNFDLLISVNFPDVPRARLYELAAIYGATLQRQVPVGHMSGGVNKRLVRQFRMPGFPLSLISTDVLQEGEDLHTFCRRVVHYGISWTPSAMEQRTGRVDRIGSLVQRRLDGSLVVPDPVELLQVFYPHLRDTVEVFQVRRVLHRLNRFLRLITKTVGQEEDRDSRIDAAREVLEELEAVAPVLEPLESAFPVAKAWLGGQLGPGDVPQSSVPVLEVHLERLWDQLMKDYAVESQRDARPYSHTGFAYLAVSGIATREQLPADSVASEVDWQHWKRFRISLHSQAAGAAALLRCESHVGKVNLRDDETLDLLYDLQRDLGQVKVCARRSERDREDMISVEGDILFDPETTDPEELETLVSRVVYAAAALRVGLSLDVQPAGRRLSTERHAWATSSPEVGTALRMADKLIAADEVYWRRRGRVIHAQIGHSEQILPDGAAPIDRWQDVEITRRGEICVFRSVVVGRKYVTRNHAHWRRLAYRVWRKNAEKDLVSFAFDREDRLIGLIEQPLATMAPKELSFYVETVAKECDRFEYVLTGEDVG